MLIITRRKHRFLESFFLYLEVWVKDFEVFDLRFGFSMSKSPWGQILDTQFFWARISQANPGKSSNRSFRTNKENNEKQKNKEKQWKAKEKHGKHEKQRKTMKKENIESTVVQERPATKNKIHIQHVDISLGSDSEHTVLLSQDQSSKSYKIKELIWAILFVPMSWLVVSRTSFVQSMFWPNVRARKLPLTIRLINVLAKCSGNLRSIRKLTKNTKNRKNIGFGKVFL